MLVIIPFTSFAALVSCASIFAAPGLPHDATAQMISPRQATAPANQNGMQSMNAGNMTMSSQMKTGGSTGPMMSGQEKEAQEEAEEKKPGLNTIANAMNELYFHERYGSQRNEPMVLLKMVGQAAGSAGKTGDPEMVSKAMLATFDVYNQGKPSSISGSPISPLNKSVTGAAAMEDTLSLKTVAHTLHETWEKFLSANPKPQNAQLIPVMCQAISSSSASGDPAAVSKAIDAVYTKMVGN